MAELHARFGTCGEILEIDMTKKGTATIQFSDVVSVVRAIRANDGAVLGGAAGNHRVKLSFARPMPTKCVWTMGIGKSVPEDLIYSEFGRFGKIKDVIVDRNRGHALIYYDEVRTKHDAKIQYHIESDWSERLRSC